MASICSLIGSPVKKNLGCFGDFKGHGFDLESTQLHDFLWISRLTLAVALLYL